MSSSPITLRIGHLYGDIMNTYGDWGNLAALSYRAKQRGYAVEIHNLTIGDTLPTQGFDCYFFGGGQDLGQEVVAPDLQRLAEDLRREIEAGAGMLAVCGGYQLLGVSYHTGAGVELPGANILPVHTTAGATRMMTNLLIALNPQLTIDRRQGVTAVGFENHSGQTWLHEGAQPLGRVIKGHGNNGSDSTEGVVYHHAIGTYLHGSCLPKNPHLADWLIAGSLQRRYGEVELAPLDDTLAWRAHQAAAALKP